MTVRAKLREIAEAAQSDPKRALLDSIGSDWLDSIEIFHNQVLVATYIEPEKTRGGIIRPDRTLAENRFQGKAALVLKMGPLAFVDDNVLAANTLQFSGALLAAGKMHSVLPLSGVTHMTPQEVVTENLTRLEAEFFTTHLC